MKKVISKLENTLKSISEEFLILSKMLNKYIFLISYQRPYSQQVANPGLLFSLRYHFWKIHSWERTLFCLHQPFASGADGTWAVEGQTDLKAVIISCLNNELPFYSWVSLRNGQSISHTVVWSSFCLKCFGTSLPPSG